MTRRGGDDLLDLLSPKSALALALLSVTVIGVATVQKNPSMNTVSGAITLIITTAVPVYVIWYLWDILTSSSTHRR